MDVRLLGQSGLGRARQVDMETRLFEDAQAPRDSPVRILPRCLESHVRDRRWRRQDRQGTRVSHGRQLHSQLWQRILEDGHPHSVQDAKGWHTDNDYYRQFLDSSTNALTIINCFTDVKPGQGGTFLAEDGIKGIVDFLCEHPEGIDPPFFYLYRHLKNCKKFTTVEAKAGDVFVTHALLPHSPSKNHLHEVRVITNPHVNLKDPYNLNRPDGNYTLCEQVILRALGRDSVPEFKPTRPREVYFPRTFTFKRARVQEELDRLVAAAKAKGLPADSVDSIYLRGEEFIKEHEKRNGYDRPHGPGGLCLTPEDPIGKEFEKERMKVLGI